MGKKMNWDLQGESVFDAVLEGGSDKNIEVRISTLAQQLCEEFEV